MKKVNQKIKAFFLLSLSLGFITGNILLGTIKDVVPAVAISIFIILNWRIL